MSIGESAPALPPAKASPLAGAAPTPPPDTLLHLSLNGPVPGPPAEPAPPTVPTGPADLVRRPAVWERVAWYAGAAVLTCLFLVGGLRLDAVDLHSPLSYDGDVLLIMPMVKATMERGSHWRNERLGYPGVQELHDFPVIDHLHFALIWLLGKAVPEWVVVYNLYFLLTWPLTTLTAMYAFRYLRLTLPMAAVGGILYAFLPYHYLRGESHYFLAAYWVVPLSWLPALAVCRGDLPFFRRDPDGRYRVSLRRWETLWQVLLGAATASAGAYYAFFACALYSAAGVYGWVVHRTWKAAAAAGVLAALVAGFGVVNHLPTFAYTAEYGRNSVAERAPEEGEIYALKIAHLVLPVDGHNLIALGRLKSMYNTGMRPLNNENTCASLGAIGAVGLLVLLAVLLLPGRRGWPYGPLSAMAGFIVLFATIGGFASLFNLLVFDQIRCPNRFSIYLAFVCLFAALWPVDRFLVTRTGWARWLRYPGAAALVALGIADQTPTAWFGLPIIELTKKEADRFQADRRFFARVEEQMPPGAKIFTVPYIPFPEVPAVHRMNTYEHARGYLHTDTLVWSYGAMKNREVDAWQQQLAHRPRNELLHRIVVRGFDGLFVDKRGFQITQPDAGDAFIADIKREAEKNGQVKIPVLYHEDGQQVFLDLRPYRDWLVRQDPMFFEEEAKREREWGTMIWLQGFASQEPAGLKDRMRWAYRSATARVINPANRTRKFRLVATFGVDSKGEFRIWVDGGGLIQLNKDGGPGPWVDEMVLGKNDGDWDPGVRNYGPQRVYEIEVPPGQHVVKFRCQVPPKFMPASPPFCFFLKDVSFVEVK
ncbi:MAG: hypothetical protein JWO38_367 [Gemmataceae bacterium]|nr:hypothetical protein [Gemmataceae bacterium]